MYFVLKLGQISIPTYSSYTVLTKICSKDPLLLFFAKISPQSPTLSYFYQYLIKITNLHLTFIKKLTHIHLVWHAITYFQLKLLSSTHSEKFNFEQNNKKVKNLWKIAYNIEQNIYGFSHVFSTVSIHHKWNKTRSLSPKMNTGVAEQLKT